MSAAISFSASRLRCRQVDEIMESGWQYGAGEKAGALGRLNFSLESYVQLHENCDNYNVLGDRDDACKILQKNHVELWS